MFKGTDQSENEPEDLVSSSLLPSLFSRLVPPIPYLKLKGSLPPRPFLPWFITTDTPLVSQLLVLLLSKPFSTLYKRDLSKMQNDHASFLYNTFNGSLLLSSLSLLPQHITHFVIWFRFNSVLPSVLTIEDPGTQTAQISKYPIL